MCSRPANRRLPVTRSDVPRGAPEKWSGAIHALGGHGGGDGEVRRRGTARGGREARSPSPSSSRRCVRLLQLPEEVRARYDVSSLRLAVHAAAPCPPDVKQAMIDWLGLILSSTTARPNSGSPSFPPGMARAWLGAGKSVLGPVPHLRRQGNGSPGRRGGAGLLRTRQVDLLLPQAIPTRRRPPNTDHENWTTVGDLGYVDEDGYVFLTDRKAFMIISGGVNIYPQEVENALTPSEDLRRRGDRCS